MMEPFMFHDGGAEGRTLNLKIIKKMGNTLLEMSGKGNL